MPVLAAVLFLSLGLAALAGAQTEGQACPLAEDLVRAELPQRAIKGKVNERLHLEIKMTPPEAPSGFFYASTADMLSGPPGAEPEVVTGVPRISLRFAAPGRYLLLVRVNLIAKSSCGGAKARILTEQKVEVDVSS